MTHWVTSRITPLLSAAFIGTASLADKGVILSKPACRRVEESLTTAVGGIILHSAFGIACDATVSQPVHVWERNTEPRSVWVSS